MIYVTLRSNSSMDVYPENKILSFKVNLPKTLQVDLEYWEVALKRFSFLIYGTLWEKTKIILLVGTVLIGNKRVEFKFMKEKKADYYSSMPEIVAELNAKMPAQQPKNINLH